MANGTPKVRKAFKAKRDMEEAFYKQIMPKKRQEIADSKMISEDHNAISNLSPNFINRQFNPDRFMESLGRFNSDSDI